MKRNPDKTDFCYFPFFEVLLTADGKYKPCSKHEEFITHDGRILESNKDSVDKAWKSDYMQGLRESFLKGERRKGCRECWREQDMGLKPMRYDSYQYRIPESQVQNPNQPLRVEINASNICNLKCRICMPTAAHKWIKEARDLYGWEETIHHNMTDFNMQQIKKWAHNFTEIGFFGGEPLLAKENVELMRYCVENGFSKNISILLNTNGTVYSDDIVELFKNFKHVYLNFSIDDIGKRFEYQRKNARWEMVVENMKKFIIHGGYSSNNTIECKICCSVTNMNIYYFPEYFEFMNEHFPEMPVYWNLIYEPWQFSIEILPNNIKEIIQERLKNYVKTTYKMDRHGTKTIEDLIIFLNNTLDKDFQGFFDKIEKHDKYRKESFAETFPEFWQLIAPFKKETTAEENYYMSPKPEIPDDKDYKQAFISEMEKFAEWKNVKHKIEELEEMVATIESPERMYHRFYNASESAVLDACVKNDVNRLFEIYKENR